jgi:glycosyltransferase involved in cell wall biosynthesis
MPWLKLHRHGDNRGVNAACNTGLRLVSGDFVLFSAADDRLDSQTVERASAAAFPSSGIVFSDHAEMSADGAATRIMPLDLPRSSGIFLRTHSFASCSAISSTFTFRAFGST